MSPAEAAQEIILYLEQQGWLSAEDADGPIHPGEERTASPAGAGSVLYLYSQTAPREIQELSPSARVIIMLRNPVEMVPSLHAHNLLIGHEDLFDLDEALAAEPEREQGRRIASSCLVPAALRY